MGWNHQPERVFSWTWNWREGRWTLLQFQDVHGFAQISGFRSPVPSIGLVYLPMWKIDVYGKCKKIYHTEMLWVRLFRRFGGFPRSEMSYDLLNNKNTWSIDGSKPCIPSRDTDEICHCDSSTFDTQTPLFMYLRTPAKISVACPKTVKDAMLLSVDNCDQTRCTWEIDILNPQVVEVWGRCLASSRSFSGV